MTLERNDIFLDFDPATLPGRLAFFRPRVFSGFRPPDNVTDLVQDCPVDQIDILVNMPQAQAGGTLIALSSSFPTSTEERVGTNQPFTKSISTMVEAI